MARAGILYSQVAQAAEKIAQDGKNPTVDNVREALGSTGSKSTITPFLKRWKTERQEIVAKTEAGIPATLLLAVKGVYENLQDELNQKLDHAQQAHEAELRTATDNAQRLKAENQAFSEKNAALSSIVDRTKDAMTQLQAEQHALSVTLATVQSENNGLLQRLDDRVSDVAALNQQLKHARTQFEHYQEATASQRSEERQVTEQRIARLEQELTGARQALAMQQSTIGHQTAQLSQLTGENERIQEAMRAAQQALEQARSERAQLAYQVTELSTARAELIKVHDGMQQILADARTALAVQAKEFALVTERLKHIEARSETLAQEKLSLLQERAVLEAQRHQWEEDGRSSKR